MYTLFACEIIRTTNSFQVKIYTLYACEFEIKINHSLQIQIENSLKLICLDICGLPLMK